jgi:hypothetical protein
MYLGVSFYVHAMKTLPAVITDHAVACSLFVKQLHVSFQNQGGGTWLTTQLAGERGCLRVVLGLMLQPLIP